MGFIADIGGLGESIFGGDVTKNSFSREEQNRFTDIEARGSSQLKLDPAAIQQIIKDVFSGEGGLKDIFGAEQTAGIFNSSVVKNQVSTLVSDIVGELAKITGETVTADRQSENESVIKTTDSTQQEHTAGLQETSGLAAATDMIDHIGLREEIADRAAPEDAVAAARARAEGDREDELASETADAILSPNSGTGSGAGGVSAGNTNEQATLNALLELFG